jgi:uncharacterized protein
MSRRGRVCTIHYRRYCHAESRRGAGHSAGATRAVTGSVTVGVLADTHGLLRPELPELFKGVAAIIHAGDIGSPGVLEALRKIAPVHAVRGNVDTGDWAAALPRFDLFAVAGRFVYLLHDLKTIDLDPVAAGIQVVISGHSHLPGITAKSGVLFLNPGSAGPKRFKLPIAAALLRFESTGEIKPEIRVFREREGVDGV